MLKKHSNRLIYQSISSYRVSVSSVEIYGIAGKGNDLSVI